MLLQVLDDGRLTDGQGRVVSFKNAIIIMTSNVGSQMMHEWNRKKTMGDMMQDMADMTPQAAAKKMSEFQTMMEDTLRTTFRPEFLNRIDEIITFDELSIENMEPIVDLQLADVRKRLADRRVTLDVTPAAREHLAIDGFDPVYGARPLKRLVQREVVDRIAGKMVAGEVRENSHVCIDLDADGDYTCRVEDGLDAGSLNLDDLNLDDLDL